MKRLLVTGGTGGLGQFVVRSLAREYECIVLHRSDAAFDPLRSVANVKGAASPSDIDGPLFGLVHLAGGFAIGADGSTARKLLDANLLSFADTYELAGQRLEQGGRIIAISAAASLTLPAGLAAYNASKAALNAWIQTLARDLSERSITANALLPTALATPAMSRSTTPLVPLERVAEWIAFLLSESGSVVTGQLITLTP